MVKTISLFIISLFFIFAFKGSLVQQPNYGLDTLAKVLEKEMQIIEFQNKVLGLKKRIMQGEELTSENLRLEDPVMYEETYQWLDRVHQLQYAGNNPLYEKKEVRRDVMLIVRWKLRSNQDDQYKEL